MLSRSEGSDVPLASRKRRFARGFHRRHVTGRDVYQEEFQATVAANLILTKPLFLHRRRKTGESRETASVLRTNGTSLGPNLMLHNKFRIAGDFGPLPAIGTEANEWAEKRQALVASGDKAWHLLSASILSIMAYA
jgi:hypothetical protein